uniref:Uncharacterized protein n=1 Tax=Tanacetum cinerariifolium TaxID=118510 RepID=A0A6L2JBA7_TANCI|nr:hypothetical protein [Tanacetum cinerariifolium]
MDHSHSRVSSSIDATLSISEEFVDGNLKSRNKVCTEMETEKSKSLIFVVDYTSELKKLKQVASVKEYYESYIDILNRLQHPQEYSLSYFVDGLKEDIRCMVMLFKPQTIHEAYCLAKLQEATLEARKPKELIRTTSLPTQNRPQEKYPKEHTSVDRYAINTEFQALLEYDTHTIQLEDIGETKNDKDVEKIVLEDVEEQEDSVAHVVSESPQELLNLGPFVSGKPNLEIQIAKESKEAIEGANTGSEVVSENEDMGDYTGYAYVSRIATILKQLGNIKDIKKLELNEVNEDGKVVEASQIKDNILRQPSDDLNVVENFEWKPGSYVGLADLTSSIKELFATSFTDVSGQWYWDEIIKILLLESDAKHLYMAAEFTKDLDALSALSEVFSVDFFSSQTKFKTFNILNEMPAAYFLEELMIKNKKKDVKKWLFEIQWKTLRKRKLTFWYYGITYLNPWRQHNNYSSNPLFSYEEFSKVIESEKFDYQPSKLLVDLREDLLEIDLLEMGVQYEEVQ